MLIIKFALDLLPFDNMTKRNSTCVTFILFFCIPALTEASFPDVSNSHSNYEAINYVQSEEIVSGYPDGTYQPNKTINRAEFTKILIGSAFEAKWINECKMGSNLLNSFISDIPANAWFTQYVCQALDAEIVRGYPDGTFRPEKEINFAEASKILAETYRLDFERYTESWYKGYVEVLGINGAIPTSISGFTASVTRGEMAEMIYRLRTENHSKPTRTYHEMTTQPAEDVLPSTTNNDQDTISSATSNDNEVLLDSIPSEYSDDGCAHNMGRPYYAQVVFSSDGSRVAYARENGSSEGEGWRVVVDGNPGKVHPESFSSSNPPVFSDDGSRIAYTAKNKNAKRFVVVDGTEGPLFSFQDHPEFPVKSVRFTSNTNKIVYPVISRNNSGEVTDTIVIDNQQYNLKYPMINVRIPPIKILPNGDIAYIGVAEQTREDYIDYLCDGIVSASECEELYTLLDAITGLCDEGDPAEGCMTAIQEWWVAHDQTEVIYKAFDSFYDLKPPTANSVIFIDQDARVKHIGKRFMGRAFAPSFLTVSSDGQTYAYNAANGMIVEERNGFIREIITTGSEGSVLIDIAGRNIAYVVAPLKSSYGVKQHVVFGSKKFKEYDSISSNLTYNPRNETIAYSAKIGNQYFIVNGENEGKKYKHVGSLVISDDGKHIAYIAYDGNKWFVVLDGNEGQKYDKIFGEPIFDSNNREVSFGVLRGQDLLWVTEKVN